MSVNISEFRIRFPEFSDNTEYPNSRVQLFLNDSAEDIGTNEARWGGKYDRAQSYLTAHLLSCATKTELGDTAANVGAVQSKSAGGVSVSKAIASKNRSDKDDFYMSTSYGQQFLIIRNSCFVGVLVANCL